MHILVWGRDKGTTTSEAGHTHPRNAMFFGVGFVGGGDAGSVLQVGKCHAGHLQSEVVMCYHVLRVRNLCDFAIFRLI